MSTKIGFIGLGQMGKWMALNLVKAGFELTVLDLNQAAVQELVQAGARAAASPREVAQAGEWVFLSLPNTAVVQEVIFGGQGLAEGAVAGTIICDCGTTSYLPTLDMAQHLAQQGVTLVDAPVSGMEARSKTGELTIMYGGAAEVFEALFPALRAMGDKVLHMGGVGSGQLTKLVNQLMFNIACAGMAEVLPLAVKLGLDPEKVTEVVTTGTGRCFALEYFAPRALDGVFGGTFPMEQAYKDMVSAAEISAHRHIPLPMTAAATVTYQLALAQGLGQEGKGAMIKVFERLLDVEFRRKV